MKMKTQWSKTFGMQQKRFQERTLQQYSPAQEARKISDKRLNLTLKEARKIKTKQNPKPVEGRK